MRYVADTHAFIWYLSGSPRLGDLFRSDRYIYIPHAFLSSVIILNQEFTFWVKAQTLIEQLRSMNWLTESNQTKRIQMQKK